MLDYTTNLNGYSNVDSDFSLTQLSVSSPEEDHHPLIFWLNHGNNYENHLVAKILSLDVNTLKFLWAVLVFSRENGRPPRPVEVQTITGLTRHHIRTCGKRLDDNALLEIERIPPEQRSDKVATIWYRLVETDLDLLEKLLNQALTPAERELGDLNFKVGKRSSSRTKEVEMQSIDKLLEAIRLNSRENHRRVAKYLKDYGPTTIKGLTEALGLPRTESARDPLNRLVKINAATKKKPKGSKEFVFSLAPHVYFPEEFTPTTEEVSEEMHRPTGNVVESHALVEGNGLEAGLITERLLKLYPAFDANWDAELKKAWFDTFGQLLQIERERRNK